MNKVRELLQLIISVTQDWNSLYLGSVLEFLVKTWNSSVQITAVGLTGSSFFCSVIHWVIRGVHIPTVNHERLSKEDIL